MIAAAFDRTFSSLNNPFRAAEASAANVSKIVVLFDTANNISAQTVYADPSKIASAKPDVLYMPIFTAEGGYTVAQSRDVSGLEKTVLIGSDGIFSGDFVKAAGPNVKGMYLSSPNFSALTSSPSRFTTVA